MASWSTHGTLPPWVRVPGKWCRWSLAAAGLAAVLAMVHEGVGLARSSVEPEGAASRPLVRRPGGGSLVIVGGKITEEIRDEFVVLAGGPEARLVVIPTASDFAESSKILDPWSRYRLASIACLHARDRKQAEVADFARPLDDATGVWFSGGLQSRLVARYIDTEVERQLHKVLERGGVVGGSSAGAAVMTRVMIAGGRNDAVLGRGFDLLPDAVIDQHFLKRNRYRRLLSAVTRNPGLLGLGIDEQTALVVDVRAWRARVVGKSYVVACVPETATGGTSTRTDVLKAGDEADLSALRTLSAHAVAPAIDFDGF